MAAGLRIGADAILSLNGATWGSPSWSAIKLIDLTIGLQMDKIDVTVRGAGKVRQSEPVLSMRDLKFDILEDTGDSVFLALRTAYFARTLIDLACTSGTINAAGESYHRAEYKLTGWEKTEPVGGVNKFAVTVEPCYSPNYPLQGIWGNGTFVLGPATLAASKSVASSAYVTIERSGGTDAGATVDYTTGGASGVTAGVDFTTTAATLTWVAGEVSRRITIPILGAGNAGTFTFVISNPVGTGAALGTPVSCTVTLS